MKHLHIITPSAPTKPVDKDMIIKAKAFLEETGRKVTMPSDIFEEDLSSVHILRSDSDAHRFNSLKEALDSDTDEIMALIGGYVLSPD